MIDLIKLSICLVFLLYSCRCDLKTRTVPNELWGVVFVAALPLVIADALAQGNRYLMHTAVSVVCIYIFVYVLFQLGVFGGADAKALIMLSFIFPSFPDITIFGYGLPLAGTPILDVFAFSVFVNAIFLTPIIWAAITLHRVCAFRDDVPPCLPGFPFMLAIMAGLMVAIIYGDLAHLISNV